MSYGQQPGNWSDQSWPNPNQPYSDAGYQGYPGYPQSAVPASPGYGYGYPAPVARQTNGLAIASMVVSLVSILICIGLPAIVGAIMGHVARKQIRERGEDGDGMALTGIIVGWVVFGLTVALWGAYFIFAVWLVSNAPDYEPSPYQTY